MHQEVAVIHQYPFRRIISFNADRQLPDLLQALLNLIANRVPLPRVRNGADDEVIRERGNLAEIENTQVKGFLGFRPPGSYQPIRRCLYSGRLMVSGTARQTRLNVLLRLAYYSRSGLVSIKPCHNWILQQA